MDSDTMRPQVAGEKGKHEQKWSRVDSERTIQADRESYENRGRADWLGNEQLENRDNRMEQIG